MKLHFPCMVSVGIASHATLYAKSSGVNNRPPIYTVSKKVPTYVTLSNLNRFSKFLHCRKTYKICYKTHM